MRIIARIVPRISENNPPKNAILILTQYAAAMSYWARTSRNSLTHATAFVLITHPQGRGGGASRPDRTTTRTTHSHGRGGGGIISGFGVYSTPSRFLSRNSCQLPSSIIFLIASVIAWHLSEPGGIPTP